MAWTQADLDKINRAIASGTLSVGQGDKRVQYRSLDEMKDVRDEIARDLGQKTETRPKASRTIFGWG